MLSRVNSMGWMEGNKEVDEEAGSWVQNNKDEMDQMGALSTFKSILDAETEWYSNNMQSFPTNFNEVAETNNNNLLLDSSSSCSPSSASVFNNLDPSQVHFFIPNNNNNKLNALSNNNPLENGFDLGCEKGFLEKGFLETQGLAMASVLNNKGGIFNGEKGFLETQSLSLLNNNKGEKGFLENQSLSLLNNKGEKGYLETQGLASVLNNKGGIFNGGFHELSSQNQLGVNNLASFAQFPCSNLLQMPQTSVGFGPLGFGDSSVSENLFLNRSKLLKPLDNFASIGAQPTLFQKRAALRKNLANNSSGNLGGEIGSSSNLEVSEMNERKRKCGNGDELEDVSLDGSMLNYDSDDLLENANNNKAEDSVKNVGNGNSSNATSTVTGVDQKGKKKGLPAKNLMAERRRRKKLNDRLYMLRSVVPKISKMDRASILGDAIEYLKELLQKINDLHNELESTPPNSSLTQTASFYPLTPTAAALPGRIKEELCPSSFASPLSSPTGQPARVEVRAREGRAVNIHMFCSRRPGLLLSTMRALESLGLDIQQAVISCFNGFALDIFRAEQCKEGQDVHPEQIKAVLLDSAGFHGMI